MKDELEITFLKLSDKNCPQCSALMNLYRSNKGPHFFCTECEVFMHAEAEVFKIQLPIVTNDPHPEALVYNEDKSKELYIPITKELLNVSREIKFFRLAYLDDHDIFQLYPYPIDDPGW